MLSITLILFTSIFFTGIILRTKSITSGRKGPGLLQPVKDVIRLFKKGAIYSETTSIIFRIAPAIYFSTVFMACLVIPFGSYKGIVSFDGDFIFFAYILALGKFFSIISAMDTGSSFEGMGASREALYSMFAEPAFFILFVCFADWPHFILRNLLNFASGILYYLCIGNYGHFRSGNDCHDRKQPHANG